MNTKDLINQINFKDMKTNKFTYYWVIWTNYGYGWEPESCYDKKETAYSQVVADAKEYRIAGAQTRIKNRRELNKQYK